MDIRPYKRLAALYDKDWGGYCLQYLKLIDYIIEKYKFVPKSILDIACGTGNLLAKLYDQKYNVIGIDITPEMIEIAKNKYPYIKFHIGDMCYVNLKTKVNLITCAFDSLNYIRDDNKIDKTFKNIYKHLHPDGFFLFDINTPILFENRHYGIINHEYNGKKFEQILTYNRKSKIAKTVFHFENGELEEHIQKAYTRDNMKTFLMKNKFKIMDTFEDFDFNIANKYSSRIIFITCKK